jgi:hypothetical protein
VLSYKRTSRLHRSFSILFRGSLIALAQYAQKLQQLVETMRSVTVEFQLWTPLVLPKRHDSLASIAYVRFQKPIWPDSGKRARYRGGFAGQYFQLGAGPSPVSALRHYGLHTSIGFWIRMITSLFPVLSKLFILFLCCLGFRFSILWGKLSSARLCVHIS